MRSHNQANALGAGVNLPMTEQAQDVFGCFDVTDVEPDQTVSKVRVMPGEEPLVMSEKGRTLKCVEQWNDIGILNTGRSDLTSDLPERDSPASEQCALVLAHLLVQ